ncbi:MAG TPA: gamma-glutamylcyclotransferase family protein [Bradyrhizobium sp.]|nr:gamma-glutamylcyclotransferase family protein [Bradyrhizobium sp.]
MTSNHLFVYGTLMRGFDHPIAKLLSRNAGFCGDARCRGRLYLVKHYPGLVPSDDANDMVHGELYRLHAPEACFAILDDYEGCGPGLAEPQYLRQPLAVTRHDGSVREAWGYVYNRPVTHLKRIQSGRFLGR